MYVLPFGLVDPSPIGRALAVTTILGNSKVTTALPFGSDRTPASVISPLLMWGHAGAIVNHLTAQFQNQERLLEEAKRDLEVYKKAFFIAEREKRDLEERFGQERLALNDEIRQLKERGTHNHEERFEREREALNDGILELKVRLFPPIESKVFWDPLAEMVFVGYADANDCVFRFPIRQP